MLDVEEGGTPLHTIDMEETNYQPLGPPLHGPALEHDAADDSMHTADTSPPIPTTADPSLEQDMDEQEVLIFTDVFEPHPLFMTNANPGILMPDNHNCLDFLRLWQWHKRHHNLKDIRGMPRNEDSIAAVTKPRVKYDDLMGDECDLQGINWRHLGVTRSWGRKCRARTFRNYTNKAGSDTWHSSLPDRLLARNENYFRYRSMDLRPDVRLLHFQLRNIMGCPSRNAVYYPSLHDTVTALNPTNGLTRTAMRFKSREDAAVSTLAAEEGILITGGFYGTYQYRHLEAEDESSCYDGRLTDHISGITNHVQVNSSRSSSVPLATFASNDCGFRIVDLSRNELTVNRRYQFAVNCTALSPDKRLRVMVGDEQAIFIAEAETGEIVQRLEGHRDFGFACDWAPDGWTVATGNQDKSIRIWDARKWKNSNGESISTAVMRCEMAGVRSLRFSPLGSGKRLLLAAEEADIINIVDAQTFNSKQTVDIFGELAGVSFTSAGQEIVALSSDPVRGGVLCLERCDHGVEDTFDFSPNQHPQEWWHTPGYDWLPTPQQVVNHPDTQVTLNQKKRMQAVMSEDWLI
ncbi:WD40 repeat-like protein [Nemania sp. NC0429]|nr:WD40 repeat-like protein [Nemania sp. NC0429]